MKDMSQIEVKLPAVPAGSYKIHISSGTLSTLWHQIDKDFAKYRKFIVTDSNIVAAGHLKTFLGKNDIPAFVIDPPGEISKHIHTVISIIETMEKGMFGRDSVLIALGGGTVGDIAGFAAAIFKRGVPVVQIPTTTVSQADSSVGGKTGVDSTISKNAFGSFWQPAAVHIDVAVLKTLDDIQYRAGLVESVKHALIADADYFEFFETNMPAILSRDLDVLEKTAFSNCTIKAAVVAEDPTEKNKRRILNFGHTIGHAVETASSFEFLHGQAVAIGIIGAELIAQQLNLSDNNRLNRIKKVLEDLDMPLKIPTAFNKKELINLIKHDKKAVNKWPKFILIDSIGTVLCKNGLWAHDVSKEIVEKTLDRLY